MRVLSHSASNQDRDGAGLFLDKVRRRFSWLDLIWADGGYNAWQVDATVAKVPPLRLQIVKPARREEGLCRPAAPLEGRAHLLPVRPQSASRQGFREPRRNAW
jgi:hypothetical protein